MASALGNLPGTVNAAKLGADYRRPARTLASPAGQGKIAFKRSVEGRSEIDVINPDGSERMVLSQNGNSPEWSPDGTKIAFVSQREHSQDIYIMNADGTGEVRITYSSDWDWGPLSWSPSGTKIAFARTPPFFTENPDVWVMNADGSREIQLTTDPSDDWQPSWSPDGTKIAFVSYRGGYKDIWVMNADGSDPTNLINDSDWDFGDEDPAWSPDGSKIAFVSRREGEIDRSIYVMNTDGSNITRLTTSTGDNAHPSWSPDGTRIAFASNRDGNYDIYIMNADGTNETRLTYDTANESGPSWGIAADTGVIEECLVTIIDGPEADPATVESNGSAQLSVSVTDSLDHDIYYNWTATGGSFDNDESQDPIWYAPVNTSSSTMYYTLNVTARCSQGTTATGSVQVGVRAEEAAPAVSTYGASDVDLTSATLNGYLESTGGLDCLVWFEYGTSIFYERSTSQISQSSEGPFSASISNLDPDTTYRFRACASNSEGTSYGSDLIFTQLTEEVRVGIDSYNVSPKELRLGEDSTLSFSFTNIGDTPWTFYAAVSLRQPNGAEVHLPLQPVSLDPDEQGNASWSYTIHYEGGWDVVFGIWKEQEQENSLGHTSWLNDYIICVQDDTNAPWVKFLSVQPGSITLDDSFTISYSVSDADDSGLNRVELWRADDSDGSPAGWVEITRNSASGNSDSGSFTDAPPSAGSYWYGIHVADNAGNWATEDSPVKVEVKLAPVTSVLQYTLTVPFNKLGGITLDPTGESPAGRPRFVISSSTGNLESSIFYYKAGTEVTLTAEPVSGYVFSHWGGDVAGTKNPGTIMMNSDIRITAYFIHESVAGGTQVANLEGNELSLLGKAIRETVTQLSSLETDNERKKGLSLTQDLVRKIESRENVRNVIREKTETQELFVSFAARLGGVLAQWATHGIVPQYLAEYAFKLVGDMATITAEKWLLKDFAAVEVREKGVGTLYAMYDRQQDKVLVHVDLFDYPGGRILIEIPLQPVLVDSPGAGNIVLVKELIPDLQGVWFSYPTVRMLKVEVESPVELMVYDSERHATGITNGEVRNEIPSSTFSEEAVIILCLPDSSIDSYQYEVIGIDKGSYGLVVTTVAEEINTFIREEEPTSAKAVHQYTIDWEALSTGKKGVIMKIDADGDGTFEDVRKLGSGDAGFSWIWIIVAGVSGLIGVFVGAFMVWRRTGKKQAA
jgi:Tol biopolymer transport system component